MTELSRHYLLVDDDERFRTRLAKALTDRGNEVTAVGCHAEALAVADHLAFDRAIVDLKMPGKNGLATVRALKELQPTIDIVVLTGYGSIATAVDAMRHGATEYLQKPSHTEQILGAFAAEPPALEETAQAFETPSLAKIEWEHIERVLHECGGNISRAARVLGLQRRTLQYKLAKFPVAR
ncbi:MAG: response regulator [Myxococcales bacterium]|nr:response regulator [Myxococcales bacterium]